MWSGAGDTIERRWKTGSRSPAIACPHPRDCSRAAQLEPFVDDAIELGQRAFESSDCRTRKPMSAIRERFIEAATDVFAERGFYGTSIAAIADALPLTKQALLHHFGSKEKLYAEVLKRKSLSGSPIGSCERWIGFVPSLRIPQSVSKTPSLRFTAPP